MRRLTLLAMSLLLVVFCTAQTRYSNFTLKDTAGVSKQLKQYIKKGKKNYVLVDFWASWCGPCCREMPNVKEAYDKYNKKGFKVVGVSLDNKMSAWKRAIKKYGITWPQISDLKGWDNAAAQLYKVNSIPYTILIDGNGKIVATGLRGTELQKKLKQIYGF